MLSIPTLALGGVLWVSNSVIIIDTNFNSLMPKLVEAQQRWEASN